MDDLAQFLRDRLDADEAIAREAAHMEQGHWTTEGSYPVSVADELVEGADVFERVVAFDEGSPSEEQAAHIARHDPARVLAEVAAKRQMLQRYEERVAEYRGGSMMGDLVDEYESVVLPLLALPYASHPGFNEAWRP